MNYEDLLEEARIDGIRVYENYRFRSPRIKGLYCDGNVALSDMLKTSAERCSVLAEELGHHYTAVGDITDLNTVSSRKLERLGRIYAYNKLIGLSGIVDAYEHRCQSRHEMAELLDVTEEFLEEAICYYREKYGQQIRYGNYVIYFEPYLAVMKRI